MADLDAQIAERVMGWTVEQRYSDGIIGWRAPGFPFNRAYTGKRAGSPWSPSTDIVAAQLMEATIEQRGLNLPYLKALAEITTADPGLYKDWPGYKAFEMESSQLWSLICATPEQRCRAALLAVV